jgi:hypothetical protein
MEGSGRGQILKYYASIFLNELSKTTKYHMLSGGPNWDSKRPLPLHYPCRSVVQITCVRSVVLFLSPFTQMLGLYYFKTGITKILKMAAALTSIRFGDLTNTNQKHYRLSQRNWPGVQAHSPWSRGLPSGSKIGVWVAGGGGQSQGGYDAMRENWPLISNSNEYLDSSIKHPSELLIQIKRIRTREVSPSVCIIRRQIKRICILKHFILT